MGRIRLVPPAVVVALIAIGASAHGAGPAPLACTDTAVRAAFASGGDFVLQNQAGQSYCQLNVTTPYTLPAGRTLSIAGAGVNSRFNGPYNPANGQGFATVSGTLTLTNVYVQGFRKGGKDLNGAAGTPGASGANGTDGAAGATAGAAGGNGTSGAAGGNGGPGGNGQDANGGAITITPSGRVTLDHVNLESNEAQAGSGGNGGSGGAGGRGGNGGAGGSAPQTGNGGVVGGKGGNGANGAPGGAGGQSGSGGNAKGGAIYVDGGTLTILSSTVRSNYARGGQGGFQNDGGAGGFGGNGGGGGAGWYGNGGAGGNAGSPAKGGAGGAPGGVGNAYGGAIYNNGGDVDVSDTSFSYNVASAGNSQGGFGGDGGWAGYGGPGGAVGRATNCGFCVPPPGSDPNATDGATGTSTPGADGGAGGAPGSGSAAIGGAVYSTTPFTVDAGSTLDNVVRSYGSTSGGGGTYGRGACTFTCTPDGKWGYPTPGDPYPQTPGTSSNPDFYPAPDAGTPKLSVLDAQPVQEPTTGNQDNAVFTVKLRPPQTATVTVAYTTRDGGAKAGQDYTAKSGTLSFAPGETSKTVSVPVLADSAPEDDETFSLELSSPSGAEIERASAAARIQERRKVSGTIVDKKGRPLAGVTVKINGIDPKVVTTDAAGAYSARVLPGLYSVEPVKPPPGQPQDGGAYEPKASGDCIPTNETCAITLLFADRVANFAYVYKVPLRGTVKSLAGNGIKEVPVRVTGTDVEGRAVDVSTSTDEKGAYSQLLSPGAYTARPSDPPGAKTPGSYDVGTCDGTKRPGACTFTIDKTPVTADFLSECERQLSFQTSMVAVGCLIRTDAKGKQFKAKGPVRINGIDFEAEQDRAPLVFDTDRKTVKGTNQTMWVSRGSGGTRWLAYHLSSFNQSFPGRVKKFTLALGYAKGGFNPAGTVNASLYGFPAHAPAFDIESTAGKTVVSLQLSLPPKAGAVLDAKTGLWKAPNDFGAMRIAYPLIGRGAVALTNDNGIQSIEGTIQPGSIFAFGTKSTASGKLFGKAASQTPVQGLVQLARVGFKYDFAADVLRLGGTVVYHARKPGATAPLPSTLPKGVTNAIGTNGAGEGFLSALIFDFEMGFKFDRKARVPVYPNRISLKVNGINRLIYPPWFLYLQRLGFDIGRDTDAPNTPLKLQLLGALTFGPRIRSDLWFQEVASLDVDGGLYIPSDTGDLQIIGNAVLRLTNVKLISGRFLWGLMSKSAELSGEMSLNLREVVRLLPASLGDNSFLGTARLVFPPGQSWYLEGDGAGTLLGYRVGRLRLRWNQNVLGLCGGSGYGVYYDGRPHAGTCDYDAFGSAAPRASAAASDGARDFTLRGGKPVAIEVSGTSAAPHFALEGPGGLRLAIEAGKPSAIDGGRAMFRDPGSKTTYVVLDAPAAGAYRLVPAPASSPIASVRFARRLPPPRVSARVRAAGCATRLSWRLAPHPGQVVRFVERWDGGGRVIVTTGKAAGSVTFTPRIGGKRARRIEAIVEQNRMPRAQLRVARFRSRGDTVAKPGRLRAKLSGRRISARWSAPCGAARYYLVHAVSGKTAVAKLVRRTSAALTLPKAPRSVKVSVWAFGPAGGYGKPAAVTLRARRRR